MRNIPGSATRVDPTMEESTPDQLAWSRERFEGSNCRPRPVDPGTPLPGSGQE